MSWFPVLRLSHYVRGCAEEYSGCLFAMNIAMK
jgi:hypothetical protein